MKLINCTTLALETENNWPSGRPPYAILSHTWAQDGSEVTYSDYLAGRAQSPHKNWTKIDAAVNLTRAGKDRLNYIWIDTCCIDKESSSELTESINSMFAWYAQAVVCYAQIADFECGVVPTQGGGGTGMGTTGELDENAAYKLGKCRWFFRGWTLQELIAPSRVEFFDKNWRHFGDRNRLAYLISMVTGIDQDVLARGTTAGKESSSAQQALRKMTVAKKMSWAEARETSRVEDIAYSLLGIFEVNIRKFTTCLSLHPSLTMLYGEGEIAFIRLQEEILKESNDMTLFAWTSQDETQTHSGILARSPKDFADGGTLVCSQDAKFNPDYAVTNKGLRISTRLRKTGMTSALFLDLNCQRSNATDSARRPIGISLQYQGAGRYVRLEPSKLVLEPTGAWVPERIIFIAKTSDGVDAKPEVLDEKLAAQSFAFTFKGKEYFDRVAVSHEDLWYEPTESFVLSGLSSFAGCLTFRTQGKCGENKNDFVVACGGSTTDPWVCVAKHMSPVYSAALEQDWEKMAANAKRLVGTQGKSAKWVDTRHTNSADFEGLEVAVKVEKVVAGVRIEVWGRRYDDATGCDTCCAECCCPKTGQTGFCCVYTD